jgi:hypothetical protein
VVIFTWTGFYFSAHGVAGGTQTRTVLPSASAAPQSSDRRRSASMSADGLLAWFREDTEVIDFFAPPRDDFLLGGKPAYMSEG